MFVKCYNVRFGSPCDVLSGSYGQRALCVKCSSVLVLPGGLGVWEFLLLWPWLR